MSAALASRILRCSKLSECLKLLEHTLKKDADLLRVCICVTDEAGTCLAQHGSAKEPQSLCMRQRAKKQTSQPRMLVANLVLRNKEQIGRLCAEGKTALTSEQKRTVRHYVRDYTGAINLFRRLKEKKEKINHLAFLADLHLALLDQSDLTGTIKQVLSRIFRTFSFDACVYLSFPKGTPPKTYRDATKDFKTTSSFSSKVKNRLLNLPFTGIPSLPDHIERNELFAASFASPDKNRHPLASHFSAYVIIPFSNIDEDNHHLIACLHRRGRESISDTTLMHLRILHAQLGTILQNAQLVYTLRENYRRIRDLHALTTQLNAAQHIRELARIALDNIMPFFRADIGAVYAVRKKTKETVRYAASRSTSTKIPENLSSLVRRAEVTSKPDTMLILNRKQKSIAQLSLPIPVRKETLIVVLQSRMIDYTRRRRYQAFFELIINAIRQAAKNIAMREKLVLAYQKLKQDKEMLAERVAEHRNRVFRIVNGMDEPLIAITSKKTIALFNDAAENLFCVDKEEIVDTPADHFINRWKIPIDEKAPHENKQEILEYTINDKFYKIIKTPYQIGKNRLGAVLVFENVTREREVEEMKNEFISILSHEMKTPLTSITGFSKLMLSGRMGTVTEKQKDCIKVIHEEGNRLGNLVEEILNLDRLEKGKLALNKAPLDLAGVFRNVIDHKIIVPEGIRITTSFPQDAPRVVADEEKIMQVLINLISNAMKFTNAGGTISVKITATDKEIITSVSDTGIGIPQKDIDHVFEKFYQISDHLTRNKGGMGLGLAIVKKILDLHSGHIEVRSKLGKGSTFTFSLPYA